jgi:hypothetical protein
MRGMMKALIRAPALALLAACAPVTTDPWAWLDDPEVLVWRQISLSTHLGVIRFVVPDNPGSRGSRTRYWPVMVADSGTLTAETGAEPRDREALRIAQFQWDRHWAGFYRKGAADFLLDISVHRHRPHSRLLQLDPDERMEIRMNHFRALYLDSDPAWQRYFFDNYHIRWRQSRQEVQWLEENQPQATPEHLNYRVPVSDDLELEFSFFIRRKRPGGRQNPSWIQRRRELAWMIVDSVWIEAAAPRTSAGR